MRKAKSQSGIFRTQNTYTFTRTTYLFPLHGSRGIENYITNQAAESLRPASTLGEHF